MKPKLLFTLVSVICLTASAFPYSDSLWIVGGGGGTGDLISVDVWLEYEGGGGSDSMSSFDIILTWDSLVCLAEAWTLGPDFGPAGANWDDLSRIDNHGTQGPPAQAKIGLSAIAKGYPNFVPVARGPHLAATIDFRIVGTPGSCTYIDTLIEGFSPPIYLGYVDQGGVYTYLPNFAGDSVCALRAINWTQTPQICDEEFAEGTAIVCTLVAKDNAGQPVTLSLLDLGTPDEPTTDAFTALNGDSGEYSWATGPGDVGAYIVYFEARTDDDFVDTLVCPIRITAAAPFKLEFKKVVAWPGQQHVLIPVWITAKTPIAPDAVGGWEVLVDFDPTAVQVVDVVYKNFLIEHAIDCDGVHHHNVSSLFNNTYYPEYFDYNIGVAGHSNWVKVTGIMDMEWPQPHQPPIDTSQMPLFALVVDVNPLWEGQEAYFYFRFTGCSDNILSDPTGYVIWGPTDEDRPAWLDYCTYTPSITLRDGADGCPGLGIMSVTVGDLNCNGMPYDVGDAIVFVNYLMYGASALCQGECASIDNCAELQAKASDINGDGYYWTIADLVMLLNKINDNGGSAAPPSDEIAELTVAGSDVELKSNVDVGAVYFVMKYEGEIGKPELNVSGMDLAWTTDANLLKVLVYSMESNPIAAGTHTLFTVPGAKKLEIDKVEIADAGGAQLGIRITVAPKTFVLYQNRPNPVRTITDIAYAIPTDSKVSLKIYDAAGMLVETLINEWKPRGFYSATWDAKDIASGVYFYKLEAGKYSATRKLIRMR